MGLCHGLLCSLALPGLERGKNADLAGTAGECIAAFGSVLAISFFLAIVRITSGSQWKAKEATPGDIGVPSLSWTEDEPRVVRKPLRCWSLLCFCAGSRVSSPRAQHVSFLVLALLAFSRELGLAGGDS